MKIGIDGRLINQTGVGRYIRNLIRELGKLDTVNDYVIFIRSEDFKSIKLPSERWEKRLVDVPWHSLKEQLMMPLILKREKFDLVHIPYFNVPILYPGRMVVTIHDLIIDHFNTGKATTLPGWKYWLRRCFYSMVMWVGLHRAVKIFAVSNSTKKELREHYLLPEEKIEVTYEGVDRELRTQNSMTKSKRILNNGPYFLYVGNAYPHKNLEFLLRCMRKLKVEEKKYHDVKLILVGAKDYFYKKLEQEVPEEMRSEIVFWGEADDEELKSLYSHAMALVFPSLMEGFGLPALEATAIGCPVVVSEIPVFKEILGEMPVYFSPYNEESLINAMKGVMQRGEKLRFRVKKMQEDVLMRYNWTVLAEKTLAVYENSSSL